MKQLILLCTLSLCTILQLHANSALTYEERDNIYHSFFFHDAVLDQNVFNYAFKGYLKLKEENKLKKSQYLSVIDYSLSANQKRFWVLDMINRQVMFTEWTSHGKYSGGEFASSFSNRSGSRKSSIGFFVTGRTYDGKHKFSLKLHGMDSGYNSNAFSRGIVIHGADYVSPDFIQWNQTLGRSYGCPAVRQEVKNSLIQTIAGGSCLFSYYPSANYFNSSRYVR